jgi:hypothetical protein
MLLERSKERELFMKKYNNKPPNEQTRNLDEYVVFKMRHGREMLSRERKILLGEKSESALPMIVL